MDETMVERVARAIMMNRVGGSCSVKDWRKEAADNVHVAQALAQARAAIEAMREPTEAMHEAVVAEWEDIGGAAQGDER